MVFFFFEFSVFWVSLPSAAWGSYQLFSRGAYLSQSPLVCLQEANRRGKPVKKGSTSAEREILGSQLAIYLSYNELQLEYRLKKVRSMKCTRTTCRGRFHKIAVQKFWWNRLPSIFFSISKFASASNNSFFSSASSMTEAHVKWKKNQTNNKPVVKSTGLRDAVEEALPLWS